VTALEVQTAAEIAIELRCSKKTVTKLARQHGIGINLGGSAGYRFTDADKRALADAARQKPKASPATSHTGADEVARQRKARRHAAGVTALA
jgi:hypothetical protein